MSIFFFLNDTATTEIYTLPLHDALPISLGGVPRRLPRHAASPGGGTRRRRERARLPLAPPRPSSAAGTPAHAARQPRALRSEEHTSELQSQSNLVCRLLLEKKKNNARHASRVRTRTGGNSAWVRCSACRVFLRLPFGSVLFGVV